MKGTTEIERVEQGAIANEQSARRIETMEVGQVVRQGDIYIHRVKEDHPAGEETKNRQLAMGETQGSRHIIDGECQIFVGTTAPNWAPRALLGPLVRLFKRGSVTHPDHAHVDLPAGTFQITHPMDARTLERVRD